MRTIYLFLLLGAIGVLVACGSIYEKEPVGIGTDYSQLKKTPCACLKIDYVPSMPQQFG